MRCHVAVLVLALSLSASALRAQGSGTLPSASGATNLLVFSLSRPCKDAGSSDGADGSAPARTGGSGELSLLACTAPTGPSPAGTLLPAGGKGAPGPLALTFAASIPGCTDWYPCPNQPHVLVTLRSIPEHARRPVGVRLNGTAFSGCVGGGPDGCVIDVSPAVRTQVRNVLELDTTTDGGVRLTSVEVGAGDAATLLNKSVPLATCGVAPPPSAGSAGLRVSARDQSRRGSTLPPADESSSSPTTGLVGSPTDFRLSPSPDHYTPSFRIRPDLRTGRYTYGFGIGNSISGFNF